MKVKIPARATEAPKLCHWLDETLGPWQEGNWRVTIDNNTGDRYWVVECNTAAEATIVALRWA